MGRGSRRHAGPVLQRRSGPLASTPAVLCKTCGFGTRQSGRTHRHGVPAGRERRRDEQEFLAGLRDLDYHRPIATGAAKMRILALTLSTAAIALVSGCEEVPTSSATGQQAQPAVSSAGSTGGTGGGRANESGGGGSSGGNSGGSGGGTGGGGSGGGSGDGSGGGDSDGGDSGGDSGSDGGNDGGNDGGGSDGGDDGGGGWG